MGIQGLLPLMKSIMSPIHIKELQGGTVAVDTYSWLHKGALSCSRELCKGLPATRHVDYCMHRVNLLRHYGVKPVLVFDGGLLPMKGEQENKRARARKENLARAIEHESNGNSSAAYECYQKAVDISPAIAYDLIQVLKQENVYYIVAPYEADAQMAFLAVNKLVDAVITEDSDLIPFGCPRILFKMDKFGQGVEFRYEMLRQNKDLNFAGFTKQMLLEMCILSGCDYLPSLPGMGLKKAHALICKFKSFDKVIKHLAFTTMAVPPFYEESFKKAILTFHHQRVYDPNAEDIVYLLDLPEYIEEDLEFLGPYPLSMPQHVARAVAEGVIDPITKETFQEDIVYPGAAADSGYQLQNVRAEYKKKKLELPAQKNILTNYFCFASLEAKRKFKAPRITKHSGDGSSPSFGENVREGSIAGAKSTSASPNISDPDVGVSQENDSVLHSTFDGTEGSQETPPLQQSRHSIHSYVTFTEKTRDKSEKVIIRSSYFRHKSAEENDPSLEKEEDISTNPLREHKKTLEGNYHEDSNLKWKASPINSAAVEHVTSTTSRIEAPVPDGGNFLGVEDSTAKQNSEDRKFGCNISHIDHYSSISENSMEKFVSVISSYAFSSSGSRASGLRAPLREVHNTRSIRQTSTMDISRFSYVPKRKSAKASR
ncbi:hypothetical protein Drorol1_Dr00005550 [Drosera rotundifolia]